MDDSTRDERAKRLRKARKDAGYATAVAAANRFHWGLSGYRSHENSSRGYDYDTAKKYAKNFKVEVSWLFDGVEVLQPNIYGMGETHHLAFGNKNAIIKGYVQAGLWEDPDLTSHEELGLVPVIGAAAKYKNVFTLIVNGDSMDKVFSEGTYLICVHYSDYKEEIVNGDKVIVEADSFGLYETTVKEFHRDVKGNIWLRPCSYNDKYKPYPLPDGMDTSVTIGRRTIEEIRIIAVVKGSYKDE